MGMFIIPALIEVILWFLLRRVSSATESSFLSADSKRLSVTGATAPFGVKAEIKPKGNDITG